MDDLSEVDRMKHPRWRGEDMLLSLELPICIETPPLARGRPVTDFKSASITGNTPAGAGKTIFRSKKNCGNGKHPRWRGEDKIPKRMTRKIWETPPLARGRHQNSV